MKQKSNLRAADTFNTSKLLKLGIIIIIIIIIIIH